MKDYVEREVVRNRLQAHYDFYLGAYGDFGNMPTDCKARVDELVNCIAEVVNAPTADVAPVVHGRWVATYDVVHICSVCGEWCGCGGCTNYCPNCGAKMDLEDGA